MNIFPGQVLRDRMINEGGTPDKNRTRPSCAPGPGAAQSSDSVDEHPGLGLISYFNSDRNLPVPVVHPAPHRQNRH